MTTLHCVYAEGPNFKDSAASHYHAITVGHIVLGWRTVDISAMTGAAESPSRCGILSTVKAIPRLENETGEYDHVPTFEVRIDKGGKGKSSTAHRICPEWPPIDIIEKIDAIGDVPRCRYVSDFVDIPYIVDSCRLDKLDAHRIPRRLDDAGSVVLEATATYSPSQPI